MDRADILISANSLWNIANFRGGLVSALSDRGYRLMALAPAGEGAKLPATVVRQSIAIDRSGINPVRDLLLVWRYYRLLRKLKPRAYLGFTIKPNIYGALAARFAGVPSLLNVSGLGTAFIKSGLFGRFVDLLYTFAFRKAAVVFFQNPDDRDLFVGKGIVRRDQARLLPGSGIDLDRFMPDVPLRDGPPVFLLIARLLGDKGVREFAEAARILKGELSSARFQLLGPIDSGNRTAIGRDELSKWVDQGIVEYLGESDDVRPFVSDATAIVLPSYREGLPRTLLEGAALARPLIATDVPGCREIAIDGVTGLLCAARSATSLADAMRRMAGMTYQERAAMGQAARQRVEGHFSEKIVIQSYLDALGQLDRSPEKQV